MQGSACNPDTVGLRACMKGARSAPEGRKNVAQGVSPGMKCLAQNEPRRGDRNHAGRRISAAPPGLETEAPTEPRAYALGYMLAPLRGWMGAFHTHSETDRVGLAGALLHRSNSRQ